MAKKNSLPEEELRQRVAVLKRFKELLQAQRDRFQKYLEVLDHSKEVIEAGNIDALASHVELEEHIIGDIISIQKVIDPLEAMYTSLHAAGGKQGAAALPADESGTVDSLKAGLRALQTEAAERAERNRALLAERMASLRTELRELRANPYLARKPNYADSHTASLVDIRG
ncbi:MAG: flagellar export chaperone FlgN [Treponema sp.]|jgi:hypothetical protein|nr:flagellar export chaperone FlgN [Treponema sp.]